MKGVRFFTGKTDGFGVLWRNTGRGRMNFVSMKGAVPR